MIIFSELETGTLDLRLDFYGYEDCLPDQFFGPAIRENYVLHYITEGKGCLEYRETFFYSYQVKLPTILRIIRLLGPTIGWGLVVSKLRSTFTSHKSMKQPILGRPLTPKH